MADCTHTTAADVEAAERAAWSAAITEWHSAQADVNRPLRPGETDLDDDEHMIAAAGREDAAARIVFTTPAPSLPALLRKIAVYRSLYSSTGNCCPPEDHADLVALASIEADVASLVCRAGGR